jgi:hypothetical protein
MRNTPKDRKMRPVCPATNRDRHPIQIAPLTGGSITPFLLNSFNHLIPQGAF